MKLVKYMFIFSMCFSLNAIADDNEYVSNNTSIKSSNSKSDQYYFVAPNKKTATFDYKSPVTSQFGIKDRVKEDEIESICITKNNSILKCTKEEFLNNKEEAEKETDFLTAHKSLKYKNIIDSVFIISIDRTLKIESFSYNFDTETIDYAVRKRQEHEKPDTYAILRTPYGQKKIFYLYEQ